MAQKAKRSKRKSTKRGSSASPWHRDAMWWASTSATLVITCGLLISLVGGRDTMRANVARIHSAPVEVIIEWPAMRTSDGTLRTWLDAGTRAMLERTVRDRVSSNRFDQGSLRRAQEALMRTGWFASDCRLWRDAENGVRVRGTWRTPSAVVRYGGQDLLVSLDGVRLPLEYRVGRSGRKVILGAAMDPPEAGDRWAGGDVQAGIALLNSLRRSPGYQQVLAIDVGEYLSGERLTLVTDRGFRIRWGGAVGTFNPGQASDDQKLRRLRYLLESTGRIDGNKAFVDISLLQAPEMSDIPDGSAPARDGG